MLKCTKKSRLIHLLEKFRKEGDLDHNQLQCEEMIRGTERPTDEAPMDTSPSDSAEMHHKIAIVEGKN